MHLLRSWVESANDPDGDFPLNNLPFGVFSRDGGPKRCCTAIGDMVLDLGGMERGGLLKRVGLGGPSLNGFMAAGPGAWSSIRTTLFGFLGQGSQAAAMVGHYLHPRDAVTLHLPFEVAEFTDFDGCRTHARSVGQLLHGRTDALPPQWEDMPLGHPGRASTVVVSGTGIHRPNGQTRPGDSAAPVFGPSRQLDIGLELGAVVGQPSTMGQPVSVAAADAMIFGYVLLNDWSARDIQAAEAPWTGPSQGKGFGTTISPWVVTRAALEPFRCAGAAGGVARLPYLQAPGPMAYDIELTVTMAAAGQDTPTTISRTSARELSWSAAQQLAHHASSGCAMRVGDLLGSGTISGPASDAAGSLLELTRAGAAPLTLTGGATRTHVEDGDVVTLTGHARGNGYTIGFGPCSGTVLPAPRFP